MEAAAPIVPIYVPVADAMIIVAWEQEGIPGDFDIPITPAHWRTVTALIREGDEIVLVAEEGGQPVIKVPAIVVSLQADTVPYLQVIA